MNYKFKILLACDEKNVVEMLTEIINEYDCLVRSIDTLEKYQLSDLIKFGKGADFNFEEI